MARHGPCAPPETPAGGQAAPSCWHQGRGSRAMGQLPVSSPRAACLSACISKATRIFVRVPPAAANYRTPNGRNPFAGRVPSAGFALPLPCPGRRRSPAARSRPPWRTGLAAAEPSESPGKEPRGKSPAESPGKQPRGRAAGRARPVPPGRPVTAAPAIAFLSRESPHAAAAPLPQPGHSCAARACYRCVIDAHSLPGFITDVPILQITPFPQGAHPYIHDTRTRADTFVSPTLAVR